MDLERQFLQQWLRQEDPGGQWKQQLGEGETGQPVAPARTARHACHV